MTTLFVIATLEGWPKIMFTTFDANDADVGPIRDNNSIMGYYFVVFIFVGSYFLLNLFVGVLFYEYTKAQKNERGYFSK